MKTEVDELQDLFKSEKAGDDDYQRLITKVREKGVIKRIQKEADGYVDKAAGFLDSLPESPPKQDLLDLGHYIVRRRH
jgi:geranylgeranyl pyrophosphate synthase